MGAPTDKEIGAEVEKLKEMKPNVRQFSTFGDDNRAGIQAQIEVLQGGMDDSEIYERFDDPEDSDSTSAVVSAAIDAWLWMRGEQGASPSSDWGPLAK